MPMSGTSPDQNRPRGRRLLDGDRQLHHVPHGQFQDLTHELDRHHMLDDFARQRSLMLALLVFLGRRYARLRA